MRLSWQAPKAEPAGPGRDLGTASESIIHSQGGQEDTVMGRCRPDPGDAPGNIRKETLPNIYASALGLPKLTSISSLHRRERERVCVCACVRVPGGVDWARHKQGTKQSWGGGENAANPAWPKPGRLLSQHLWAERAACARVKLPPAAAASATLAGSSSRQAGTRSRVQAEPQMCR